MTNLQIITPKDPEYYQTLAMLPLNYLEVAKETGFTNCIADHATGLFRQVGEDDLEEYLFGGEYDEVETANAEFFGESVDEFEWY